MCWPQAGRTLHDPPATHGHAHRPRGTRSNTHHMRPPATWEMEMIPDGALSAHTGQQHNGHMGGRAAEKGGVGGLGRAHPQPSIAGSSLLRSGGCCASAPPRPTPDASAGSEA